MLTDLSQSWNVIVSTVVSTLSWRVLERLSREKRDDSG